MRRGLSVSEYGDHRGRDAARCTPSRPRRRSTRSSATHWIPPELRENGGELEAARNGELPKLVELGDLRGDLHTHTTWSDGKDSLEAMVGRAVEKGYAYYAVCDHSHRLRDGRLEQQAEEIDALNEQVAPFRDPEGDRGRTSARTASSTWPTTSSPALDWVVASVHASFDKNPTERVLAAMENPYVDCIGHVTGRKIGKRAAGRRSTSSA